MSGKKRYRPSQLVLARVAREAEMMAAAAAARAAEQKRLREERFRREAEQRESERVRIRKIAEAKVVEEERKRQRTIEAEIQAIVTACEDEMSDARGQLDERFSLDEVKDALADVGKVAKTETRIAAVRESADKFQAVLASHLIAIKEFQRTAAECRDVVSGTAAEKPVRDFMADSVRELVERQKDAMSADKLRERGAVESCELLRDIIDLANQLVISACNLEAEYENRNRLLEATISAIRSMGFYVADPAFVNANEPFGPVALTATRGAERIVITVPLAGEIVSDWQGLPHGVCVNDFVALLDKLKDVGFPCEPSDSNFVLPSKLLKKGAKTLPGQAQERRRNL